MLIKAGNAGISVISITDHDTVQAYNNITQDSPVEIITGVEISCHYKRKEYHVLGYGIDISNPKLLAYLKKITDGREARARKIVNKLNRLGVNISFNDVLEKAGPAPITRPHIATVIKDAGYINEHKDAFYKYIGDGGIAYEDKANNPIESCFQIITATGGISSIAHPSNYVDETVLSQFIKLGMDGIEVLHPSHDNALVKYYKAIARQYWLLETGGSDYHGNRDYDDENFGNYVIPYEMINSMRIRLKS
jgi:hypothetical protein